MATVQDIVTSAQNDWCSLIEPTNTLLIDAVNRISLDLLETSNWRFLRSGVLQFITEEQRTDYWIGSGTPAVGAVNTGLALTDVQRLIDHSVQDRTNQRTLNRVQEIPFGFALTDKEGAFYSGRPKLWRHDTATPNVLNIYPAPDNENDWEPVPRAPITERVTGGTLGARTYYIVVTFVDSKGGQSVPSTDAAVEFFTNGQLCKVKAPQPAFASSASGVSYGWYNVYIGTTDGTYALQNASPIATSTDWTEPVGGRVTGVAPPSSSTIEELRGYVIQFQYLKTRVTLTGLSGTLQIPDEYKDVVVAGLNQHVARYLKDSEGTSYWASLYAAGKARMIRDKNLLAGQRNYISTDPAYSETSDYIYYGRV